ncbi:hypothetical protein F4824DRAFT_45636 [Ustulina deusta]|nr:hypothetical protein F4824DRAFT_45636 [Ustulina deusta]
MGIKHDAASSSVSYQATKATDFEVGFKDFTGGPPSSKLKVPTPVLDPGHREIPVHVTQQLSRTVDAERPPRNRKRASKPPGKGGADKQSGNYDKDQPFGNGNGGDRDPDDTGTARLGNIAVHGVHGTSDKWRWVCSDCSWTNLSYTYDNSCIDCGKIRDTSCHLWAVE